jgi:hypothetical protein
MPYDAAFDHKPVALYYPFAASISIFGDDPVSSRILGLFCIIASALVMLWVLTKIFDDHSLMPTIISIAYIFTNGGYGGSATFSELLVNFYVLLWMLLICVGRLDKRDSQSVIVMIQGWKLGASHDPRPDRHRSLGADRPVPAA